MASTNFRIRLTSGSGTPDQPPLAAWPLIEAPPVVRYPQPSRRTGMGYPAGHIGMPYIIIGRDRIDETGTAYYNALFTTVDQAYALVRVKAYDPRSNSWKIYDGTMWRPTFSDNAIGGPWLVGYRIRISDLNEVDSW